MPQRIRNLRDFFIETLHLLKLMDEASPVLFRKTFRENLHSSLEEALPRINELIASDYLENPEDHIDLWRAGLTGNQLELKLESIEHSLVQFEEEGGVENLDSTVEKIEALLNSIAGAIPGFGSFAQELMAYILKELKRRL